MMVAALSLGGCGGTTRAAGHASTSAGGASDYSDVRGSLVWMRQYSPESLMWQTVSVDSSGRGELTTLIGEISGAERTPFRIPRGQLTVLQRLLARSRGARIPSHHNLRATLYTLHVSGHPSVILQGTIPRRMRPLVRFLTGLMSTYCC
jgi:hypothetical protein